LTLVLATGVAPTASASWSTPLDPSMSTWIPLSGLPLAMWGASNRIDGLSVSELDDGSTVLTLRGSAKPTFNVYRLEDPDRLVVDLSGSERGQVVPHIPLDTWACGRVTLDPVDERDTKLVRMVIELKRESSYIVVPKGDDLVVTVTPREIAPETYFARKSADERRKDIAKSERETHRAKQDATLAKRDATALRAEARALSEKAKLRATEAQTRAEEADAHAAKARAAETAALAAETRAKAAEEEARAAVDDAKSNKFKARRALKAAEAEREKAQKERAESAAARAAAEAAAKTAEADLAKRKAQLAKSERAVAAARTDAFAAKKRATAAEAKAVETLKEAEVKLAAAKSKLTGAAAAAKKSEAEAAARLQKAEANAVAAERALADAKVGAKRRLEKAAEDAKQELARAKATAKVKETAAAAALADAQKAKARAQRVLADAKAKAEQDAKHVLAQAERDASKTRSSAAQLEIEAKKALARASTAVEQAEAERAAATKARGEADSALAAAKRELESAKVEGKRKRKLERRLARAQTQRNNALDRQAAAEGSLSKLERDRNQLQAKLRKQQKLSKQLETKIASHQSELDALESKVARAKANLQRAGGSVSAKELTAARTEAADTKSKLSKMSGQLAQMKSDAETAKRRAEAAEQRVAELDKQGARRRELTKARDAASIAQAEATAAKSQLSAHAAKLARVEKSLKTKQTAVAELEDRQRELEGQTAKLAQKKGALSKENGALAVKNDAARAELTKAEGELAELESSLAAKRSKLASLESDVRTAKAALDADLAKRAKVAAEPAPQVVATAAPAPEAKAKTRSKTDAKGKLSRIKDVRFEDAPGESRVIVEIDGPMAFEGTSLTPTIKMLELSGTSIASKLERSLDASAYDGPVSMVTSFAEGDATKVIVSTRGSSQARLEEKPGKLVWHFPRETVGKSEVVSLAGSKVGGYAAAPGRLPLATTASTAAAAAPEGADEDGTQPVYSSRRTRWRGERIDIELQDAPIKDVLLLFSDIGRVNIIAGRNVEGSVTMKLTSVPWDQALDIILRSLQLGLQRDGNVIRVATLEDLEAERKDAIERANAQVQLKPLETRLRPVSYATVDEMVPKVQSVLSPRGTVTPDSRTNTLIIMDVAENIALAEQLITSLDTQTPQVLIEARIVEARTTFQRQLGIQWGFDFTASPGTGNPTGLLFPNSVGVGGGATGTPADTRGLILPGATANPNYAVDLPAPVGTGSGGALGFSFGSISGNLNTNLRLSAAESTGEVRIISAPKVVTLDNSEAQIEQGVQIPISQVSAQGVNTRFVNATLSLQVTPHVTNEGSVLLDVQVQKNEADFVNTGARGDPTILTRQARSRMLVNDADTAVIGGIYTRNKAVNYTKVPWLADIPIIGWFFKNKSEADTRSEVLIFLTPRIVNRASSIGG
jgi:type IV pilus assembly protein PilQ